MSRRGHIRHHGRWVSPEPGDTYCPRCDRDCDHQDPDGPLAPRTVLVCAPCGLRWRFRARLRFSGRRLPMRYWMNRWQLGTGSDGRLWGYRERTPWRGRVRR